MKRKLLVFNERDIHNPLAGGGDLMVHLICKQLLIDFDITLLCSGFPRCKKEDVIDGIKIRRVGNRYTVYFLAPAYYLFKLRKAVNAVIEVTAIFPWFSPVWSKKPKIILIHNTKKEALYAETNFILATLLYFAERMIGLFYRKTRIITLAQSTKEELVSYGLYPERIEIVNPGIHLKNYAYKEEKKESYPLIVYLGRLKKYKGVHLLVYAIPKILKHIPNAQFLIVGYGDQLENLKSLVYELRLQDYVKFLERVSETEKIEILQKAWILIQPAVKDGWSIPALEAAACGTPTIATNTTGLRDAIIDSKTGLLFESNDVDDLVSKIIIMATNHDLRKKIANNAVDHSTNFDWEKSLRQFSDKFKEAIR